MESFDKESWSEAMSEQTSRLQQWFQKHDQQVATKPASGWSPVEVLEHLNLVERGVHHRLKTSLQPIDAEEKVGASKLKHVLITKRDVKVDAPESVKPQGIWKDWKMGIEAFITNRKALIDAVENGEIKPSAMGMMHPRLGEMSVTDWLYFLHSHAERHWHQLQEAISPL